MLLKKIVVAEDDDSIAHMVNMALGDAGFLCLRARDGEEALKLVRFQQPDLLVLDIMMPKVDGLEVVKRLRADAVISRTPVLMLTALGGVDQKVEGLEAGADDYVVKPFDLRELSARVKALIRASRRERERNPTTELPGSRAINAHVDRVLAEGEPRCVLHVDVAGFDTFADRIGYARAEAMTKSLGAVLLSTVKQHATGDSFLGHLGGVDFIVVTGVGQAEQLARDLIESFEDKRDGWVAPARAETDPGDELDASALTLAVAVSTTEGLGADDGDELARRLAGALRQAKQGGGSAYVVWRP